MNPNLKRRFTKPPSEQEPEQEQEQIQEQSTFQAPSPPASDPQNTISDEFMREIRAFKILHEKDYDEFSRLKNEIQSYKSRVEELCNEFKTVSTTTRQGLTDDFEKAVENLDRVVRRKETMFGAMYAAIKDGLTLVCVALIAFFLYSISPAIKQEIQKPPPQQPQVQQQIPQAPEPQPQPPEEEGMDDGY